jgi:glycosyltransferase involved in cell wall biosynthesis
MTISFVMQVYLGDYPGARSQPIKKFHRMINCLKNQTNQNWELIIVSDGCKIAEHEYEMHYKNDPKIKYAYVAKPEHTKMYIKNSNGKKYFRGVPRAIGVEMVTGDWISYIDSDDFILDHAVQSIIDNIKVRTTPDYPGEEVRAIINGAIIRNQKYKEMFSERLRDPSTSFEEIINSNNGSEVLGLDDLWHVYKFKTGMVPLGTAGIIHRKDWPNWKWQDTIGDISEDMKFIQPMTMNPYAPHTDTMAIPYYVVCHWTNKWDF